MKFSNQNICAVSEKGSEKQIQILPLQRKIASFLRGNKIKGSLLPEALDTQRERTYRKETAG